jgi:hypothetical protein
MLVACRLAGLSALGAHYADDNAQAQSGVDEHRSDAVLDRLRPCAVPARATATSSCGSQGERLGQGVRYRL